MRHGAWIQRLAGWTLGRYLLCRHPPRLLQRRTRRRWGTGRDCIACIWRNIKGRFYFSLPLGALEMNASPRWKSLMAIGGGSECDVRLFTVGGGRREQRAGGRRVLHEADHQQRVRHDRTAACAGEQPGDAQNRLSPVPGLPISAPDPDSAQATRRRERLPVLSGGHVTGWPGTHTGGPSCHITRRLSCRGAALSTPSADVLI